MYGLGERPAILCHVRIRNPHPGDEPDEPAGPDGGSFDDELDDEFDDDEFVDDEARPVRDYSGLTAVRFRVPRSVVLTKFGVAAALALLAVAVGEHEQVTIGLAAALAVVVYAARDVIVRDRLVADADGLVAAHGYLSRDRLAWADVQRMLVDSRLRLGARTEILELDAGDQIYQFSRFDLGTDATDALAALEAVRDNSR
jgi:hypothetical protein